MIHIAEGSSKRAPSERAGTRVLSADTGVLERLARIWQDRQLLVFLVGRDLKVKYKNSFLGFAWSLLNPALTVLVYYFVFSVALHSGVPDFAIWLMCGLVVWNFFAGSVAGGCGSMVGAGHLIKQVSFSREILALSALGTSAVYFCFQACILIVGLALVRFAPAMPYIFLVPLALIATVVFAAALAVFFSAVNVYFRDMQHLLEVILMAWFWGTPIVYTWGGSGNSFAHGLATHHLTWLYLANPMAPVVLLMQRALYGLRVAGTQSFQSKVPAPLAGHSFVAGFGPLWYLEVLLSIILASTVLFLLALKLFGRLEGNFAEEL
jgi:ABC-2 type transport system permease protein